MATFTGTVGVDTLVGGAARDTLSGLDGNDSLIGGGGNDSLLGGAGNDSLDGGTGNDRMEGGAGNDTYIVDSTADVLVDTGGTDTVRSSVTLTLGTNFEKLVLTGGSAINGTGNASANTLTGNGATNTLTGSGGDDTCNGGAGADAMDGGSGNDTYIVDNVADLVLEGGVIAAALGGPIGAAPESGGIDTVRIQTTGEPFTFTLPDFVEIMIGDGLDNVLLIDPARTAAGSLFGGLGRDDLRGGAGGDRLDGQGGNDTLNGRDGGDVLSGGDGNDTAIGGNGKDTISGGSGNDVLIGGKGADILAGDGGADTIKYLALSDGTTVLGNQTAAAAGATGDVIQNFASGSDTIACRKAVFDPANTIGLGDLDASNLTILNVAYSNNNVNAGTTELGTRQAWDEGKASFIIDGNNTLIYDANGAGNGYTVLANLGAATITATDLTIVAS